jgi:hypothetical protein
LHKSSSQLCPCGAGALARDKAVSYPSRKYFQHAIAIQTSQSEPHFYAPHTFAGEGARAKPA